MARRAAGVEMVRGQAVLAQVRGRVWAVEDKQEACRVLIESVVLNKEKKAAWRSEEKEAEKHYRQRPEELSCQRQKYMKRHGRKGG